MFSLPRREYVLYTPSRLKCSFQLFLAWGVDHTKIQFTQCSYRSDALKRIWSRLQVKVIAYDIIMGIKVADQSSASQQSFFLLFYVWPWTVSFIHHFCYMSPLIQWALTSGTGDQSTLEPSSVVVRKVSVSSLLSTLCHLSCLYISIMDEVEMLLGADHAVLPHVRADLHKILTPIDCDLSM